MKSQRHIAEYLFRTAIEAVNPTDAAGAFVDGQTITPRNRNQARHCLENNDSCRFFHDNGGLFKTGPTGTNVMDLQLVLIDAHP